MRRKPLAKRTPPVPSTSETLAAITLAVIGRLVPKTVREIHERVTWEYGDVTERTVYRVLAKLRERGEVRHVDYDEEGPGPGYVRTRCG